jgi:hypothetical protein
MPSYDCFEFFLLLPEHSKEQSLFRLIRCHRELVVEALYVHRSHKVQHDPNPHGEVFKLPVHDERFF